MATNKLAVARRIVKASSAGFPRPSSDGFIAAGEFARLRFNVCRGLRQGKPSVVDVIVPASGHNKMIKLNDFLGPNQPHVRTRG
jgi:hypothetical protein